jgi:hypothetical protein
MNWTEPKSPTEGESYYDYIKCETPLGEIKIEWSSWKETASYDVMLKDQYWLGVGHSLEEAKRLAYNYLKNKSKELQVFLFDSTWDEYKEFDKVGPTVDEFLKTLNDGDK